MAYLISATKVDGVKLFSVISPSRNQQEIVTWTTDAKVTPSDLGFRFRYSHVSIATYVAFEECNELREGLDWVFKNIDPTKEIKKPSLYAKFNLWLDSYQIKYYQDIDTLN